MLVFINGQFLPEDQAVLSIFDRGFLYGDGLFETTRVCGGEPFLWPRHLARLREGAKRLRIELPYDDAALTAAARHLILQNQMPDAVLRLAVSRGPGPRGYSARGAQSPSTTISLHPAPDLPQTSQPIRLAIASLRILVEDPLSCIKSANKLPHILARAAAEDLGADDALLLNHRGEVCEASGSNLFWIAGGTICTPPTAAGALAGTARGWLLEYCAQAGLPTAQACITPRDLAAAEGIFLTNSVQGITEVSQLEGDLIPRSPLVAQLKSAFDTALRAGH